MNMNETERETFLTPKQLATTGIISLVKQWEERKAGRLQCYRIGAKVLYGQKHINDYLSLCEVGGSEKTGGNIR